MLVSTALLIFLSVQPSSQTRVVDLTSAPLTGAQWKVVKSESGGPIGTWPKPASQIPVIVRLLNCAATDSEIYFSIEIDNSRPVEVQIPIGVNWKRFEQRGVVRFRELLIDLGTATSSEGSYRSEPTVKPVTLFGDPSAPETLAVLAPGERLILKLKTEARSDPRHLGGLRVQIAGADLTLTPAGAGYDQIRTWIPALFAASPSDVAIHSK